MKIVRLHFRGRELKRLDAPRFNGNHTVLVLQRSPDQQKRMMYNNGMVAFEQLRRDNNIRDTGFVLEAQKNKTLSGARTLPNDHRSHDTHALAVGQFS